MKNEQRTQELQCSTQGEKKMKEKTKEVAPPPPAPIQDSGSVSSNDGRKVSRQDIELVQNLIERCLQLYMNRDEVVKTLLNRARIEPGFTTLVWQKLEEENAEFFRAYYIRLKLKKQITIFNQLLEHQYHLMKYQPVHPPKLPLVPMPNGVHHIPPTNMPMGYPVLQHPQMHVPGHPHINPTGSGMASCHLVNGVPAHGSFQPMRMNSGNDSRMVIDTSEAEPITMIPPPNNEMEVSPASVASSGHFPFAASDMGMDTTALDSAFTTDVATSVGLQLGTDGGPGNSSRSSFDHIPWNFSLSDLTADLSNLGDLGALGNYPGSPFLPSDSDILLDSPEQEDIEEFFVDSVPEPPCSQSDEDKSK